MKERFEGEAKNWVKGQQGDCMCLGDCQKCNFHRCHGCLCSFIPFIQSEIDLAVAKREKEIVEKIQKEMDRINDGDIKYIGLKKSINLITTK